MMKMATNALPGTYCLIMQVREYSLVEAGSLGQLEVPPGYYLYVGSAFGPGGLAGRLAHHLRLAERMHWHVDALRYVAPVVEIWLTQDPRRLEHDWFMALPQAFEAVPGGQVPFPGFGSSDCACQAHLYYLPTQPEFGLFCAGLLKLIPDHAPVYQVFPAGPDRSQG
jgi:Uri superfamily endonuclease